MNIFRHDQMNSQTRIHNDECSMASPPASYPATVQGDVPFVCTHNHQHSTTSEVNRFGLSRSDDKASRNFSSSRTYTDGTASSRSAMISPPVSWASSSCPAVVEEEEVEEDGFGVTCSSYGRTPNATGVRTASSSYSSPQSTRKNSCPATYCSMDTLRTSTIEPTQQKCRDMAEEELPTKSCLSPSKTVKTLFGSVIQRVRDNVHQKSKYYKSIDELLSMNVDDDVDEEDCGTCGMEETMQSVKVSDQRHHHQTVVYDDDWFLEDGIGRKGSVKCPHSSNIIFSADGTDHHDEDVENEVIEESFGGISKRRTSSTDPIQSSFMGNHNCIRQQQPQQQQQMNHTSAGTMMRRWAGVKRHRADTEYEEGNDTDDDEMLDVEEDEGAEVLGDMMAPNRQSEHHRRRPSRRAIDIKWALMAMANQRFGERMMNDSRVDTQMSVSVPRPLPVVRLNQETKATLLKVINSIAEALTRLPSTLSNHILSSASGWRNWLLYSARNSDSTLVSMLCSRSHEDDDCAANDHDDEEKIRMALSMCSSPLYTAFLNWMLHNHHHSTQDLFDGNAAFSGGRRLLLYPQSSTTTDATATTTGPMNGMSQSGGTNCTSSFVEVVGMKRPRNTIEWMDEHEYDNKVNVTESSSSTRSVAGKRADKSTGNHHAPGHDECIQHCVASRMRATSSASPGTRCGAAHHVAVVSNPKKKMRQEVERHENEDRKTLELLCGHASSIPPLKKQSAKGTKTLLAAVDHPVADERRSKSTHDGKDGISFASHAAGGGSIDQPFDGSDRDDDRSHSPSSTTSSTTAAATPTLALRNQDHEMVKTIAADVNGDSLSALEQEMSKSLCVSRKRPRFGDEDEATR